MTGGLEPWGEALVEVGRYLDEHGLVTSHGGNLSVRRPAGGALITATGAMLGRLDGSKLVAVDGEGRTVRSNAPAPSSNTDIHLAIYEARPDAQAVLHAHPPYAVARTIATGEPRLYPANFEARVLLGSVPIVDATGAGGPARIADTLAECPVVLVRGHGSFAVGRDLWQALNFTSALEEAAQIIALAGRAVASSGTPVRHSALLTLEHDAHERWQAVVDRTPPDAARADGWTLKDVVAHVAAWHRYAVERLQRIERGEPQTPADTDAFNADVKARSATASWDEVRSEAEAAHRDFLEAIEKAPEAVLAGDDGLGAYVVAVNGYGHYDEHMRDFDSAR